MKTSLFQIPRKSDQEGLLPNGAEISSWQEPRGKGKYWILSNAYLPHCDIMAVEVLGGKRFSFLHWRTAQLLIYLHPKFKRKVRDFPLFWRKKTNPHYNRSKILGKTAISTVNPGLVDTSRDRKISVGYAGLSNNPGALYIFFLFCRKSLKKWTKLTNSFAQRRRELRDLTPTISIWSSKHRASSSEDTKKVGSLYSFHVS